MLSKIPHILLLFPFLYKKKTLVSLTHFHLKGRNEGKETREVKEILPQSQTSAVVVTQVYHCWLVVQVKSMVEPSVFHKTISPTIQRTE